MSKDNNELQLIDQSTGEVYESKILTTTVDDGGILVPSAPMDVRAMTKPDTGHFSCSGSVVGKSIEMTLLNYRIVSNIRPSEEYGEPTDFCQVLGILHLERPVFACLTFGKSSIADFEAAVTFMQVRRINPLTKRMSFGMEKVQSKQGFKFHVLTFETVDSTPEMASDIVAVINANPSIVTAFRDMPNIDDNND